MLIQEILNPEENWICHYNIFINITVPAKVNFVLPDEKNKSFIIFVDFQTVRFVKEYYVPNEEGKKIAKDLSKKLRIEGF